MILVFRKKKIKRSRTSKRKFRFRVIVPLIVLVSFGVGVAFTPLMESLGGFAYLAMVKDTVLVAAAGKTPCLYYIDVEKNGKDYKAGERNS